MAQIYLCFLWHMHQPFYKDLITGEYRLPWTRLHGLKDYYGMVKILDQFPKVRQTFNLVPSMMVQIEEYAAGKASEPFLELALKPAEDLSESEQKFLLDNSFHASPERMIYRYPRYGELHDAWQAAHRDASRARRSFGAHALRDLQVLSQLTWFDEEYLAGDPQVRGLVQKGRGFSIEDQRLIGRKQREILGLILPTYHRLADAGRIEISTTPYYHPILPLVCDSNIASVSHPFVPLPPPYRYPQDARRQLEMALEYIQMKLGVTPAGLWPSEGSVSDEVFRLASDCGFKWAATDSGVLDRTLGHSVGVESLYRPYRWRQGDASMQVIFRDHLMSDLIGFVYSKMGAAEAAEDFLNRVRDNCRSLLASGRDALVPIILDGENAWEHFYLNGRPFLLELYARISDDPAIVATTVSDALAKIDGVAIDHIFPASWINANFDVWIGHEEDNRAWEYLLRARETYERLTAEPDDPEDALPILEENRRLAFEELLIAEGSDWCWWYGPEHASAHRAEFDQLFRDHLANVYRALGLTPPEELSRPILRTAIQTAAIEPSARIHPRIDGEVSSYFEWLGAGLYEIDSRSGAMHGERYLASEVRYGTDGEMLFLRADFATQDLSGVEVRVTLQNAEDTGRTASATVRYVDGQPRVVEGSDLPAECAFRQVLEIGLGLASLNIQKDGSVRFQLSLWQDGLPMDAIPRQGWLDVTTAPHEAGY